MFRVRPGGQTPPHSPKRHKAGSRLARFVSGQLKLLFGMTACRVAPSYGRRFIKMGAAEVKSAFCRNHRDN